MEAGKITTQWGSQTTPFSSKSKVYKDSLLKAIKKLTIIYKREFNVDLFLTYGTLLGAVRENDFIGHDFDVDLTYISKQSNGYKIAKESSDILSKIANNSFGDLSFLSGHSGQYKVKVSEGGFIYPIEIFVSFIKEQKFYQFFWLSGQINSDVVLPLKVQNFKDEEFLVPNREESFLESIYGDDWRTPNPNFKYDMSTVDWKAFQNFLPMANRKYWNDYYNRKVYKDVWSIKPSPFCLEVCKLVTEKSSVLEIGCGNGRDSYYFASHSNNVTAVDYSEKGIQFCKKAAEKKGLYINFSVLNLYNLTEILKFTKENVGSFDVIYARFLVHAISLAGEKNLIYVFEHCLSATGEIHLEFRTIGDARKEKGTEISENEKEDGHYRRFINPAEFKSRLELNNTLSVEKSEVSDQFAVFGDEKPEVCRMVITKKSV